MSFLEHAFRTPEFFVPDTGSGGSSSGSESEDIHQEFDVGAFLALIVTESRNPEVLYDFEEQLRNAGYLSELEQIGVLPCAPQNPNPYSIVQETEDHLLWALQHQEETERFRQEIEQRENILRYLYVGGIIQIGPGERQR